MSSQDIGLLLFCVGVLLFFGGLHLTLKEINAALLRRSYFKVDSWVYRVLDWVRKW